MNKKSGERKACVRGRKSGSKRNPSREKEISVPNKKSGEGSESEKVKRMLVKKLGGRKLSHGRGDAAGCRGGKEEPCERKEKRVRGTFAVEARVLNVLWEKCMGEEYDVHKKSLT